MTSHCFWEKWSHQLWIVHYEVCSDKWPLKNHIHSQTPYGGGKGWGGIFSHFLMQEIVWQKHWINYSSEWRALEILEAFKWPLALRARRWLHSVKKKDNAWSPQNASIRWCPPSTCAVQSWTLVSPYINTCHLNFMLAKITYGKTWKNRKQYFMQ